MRSEITPGEKLEEVLYLQTGEDHITAFWALTFVSGRANSGGIIKRFEGLGYQDYDAIRAKCEELKVDVLSGLSRSRRGYDDICFHHHDAVFINQALDYLGQQSERTFNESERQKFLPYVASAQLVGRETVVEMLVAEPNNVSAA